MRWPPGARREGPRAFAPFPSTPGPDPSPPRSLRPPACNTADLPEVVPAEVYEHVVLGPLLLVREQLRPEPLRLREGRTGGPRSRNREGRRGEILHPQEHLRARADHPPNAEVQVIHVRTGIRRPESLIEGNGIPRQPTESPD